MSGRRVNLDLGLRNPDGSTGIGNAIFADSATGVIKSYICFNTVLRTYGRVGAGGNAYTLGADKEMGAYYMDVATHETGKIPGYQGPVAGFSMAEHVDKDRYFLVMLIMANGDGLTAAAILDLQSWGYSGTVPAATDRIAFVGRLGLDDSLSFECRVVAAYEIMNGACVIGGILI